MFPKDMTLSSRDLFDYLTVVMDKQNIAIAPVAEVEERTGLSTASIARAKVQLFELDYIRQKASNVFMVNPAHAFKADGDQRADAYDAYITLEKKGGEK